ncbi:SDR family oxidoreductase [Halalkalibacter alkalisediminis]|uniref:SDR family oxidoreductase n=1 Tax=Halalkalibacter alkalisediminis TaxID=935616 RepID=A0ABV6NKY8_9BACI|nr:SDR family oxidoreductase [Halalkalibacter alkalisediminis]
MQQLGGKAEVAICNTSLKGEVQKTIEVVLTEGKIDLVINHAGVGYFGPLQHYEPHQIDEIIDTNVKGTIYISQALLPHFLKQNKGKIINLNS